MHSLFLIWGRTVRPAIWRRNALISWEFRYLLFDSVDASLSFLSDFFDRGKLVTCLLSLISNEFWSTTTTWRRCHTGPLASKSACEVAMSFLHETSGCHSARSFSILKHNQKHLSYKYSFQKRTERLKSLRLPKLWVWSLALLHEN